MKGAGGCKSRPGGRAARGGLVSLSLLQPELLSPRATGGLIRPDQSVPGRNGAGVCVCVSGCVCVCVCLSHK